MRKLQALLLALVLVTAAAGVAQDLRPVPRLGVVSTLPSHLHLPGTPPRLPWPRVGEAAVEVVGTGSLGAAGGNTPEPIGSVAKVMTALVVLRAHPLGPGATGPLLTMTTQDAAAYRADRAGQQSVVPVAPGEQLTELQLLEGLLIPSGNNLATILASWDAGSQAAFVAKMNALAAALGLRHTHYADASGLSPASVSTASDQVRLAAVAMRNPTFASIVAEPQVVLPLQGVAYNVNGLVTHDGVVGVKTGSTPQAGGCFVFAAQRTVGGHRVLILGAVLGQGGLSVLTTALDAGRRLVDATAHALTTATLVTADAAVARITVPWGHPVVVAAPRTVTVVGWPGLVFRVRLTPAPLGRTVGTGTAVGVLSITAGAAPVATETLRAPSPVRGPSLRWRLTRL
ncbi:MAG TPA: D-alanyl-D-alanine carboxypeptidase [Candidatus Dormibacteraeota bacterium]|nr:D-alanyl-D-alanine carboxypeptidase [Candidatus Dormibacteraeota bacterium]